MTPTTTNPLPRSAFDYHRKLHLIPGHLRGGMLRYLENGIPAGGFLTAVLENDLMGAFSRGDDESIVGLHNLVRYLYNDVPSGCKGSPERVDQWIASGGLVGQGKVIMEHPDVA